MKKNKTKFHLKKSSALKKLNSATTYENRGHAAEFTNASRAARLLRTVMESIMTPAHDRKRFYKLMGAMIDVIQSDSTNIPGNRELRCGDLQLLKGLEFNTGVLLQLVCKTSINRLTGALRISFPTNQLVIPSSVTHFEIIAAGAAIDFEAQSFTRKWVTTGTLAVKDMPTRKITLTVRMEKGSPLPLFLFLHIVFLNNDDRSKKEVISIVAINNL